MISSGESNNGIGKNGLNIDIPVDQEEFLNSILSSGHTNTISSLNSPIC